VTTDELLAQLRASKTDLGRFVEIMLRDESPQLVVPVAAACGNIGLKFLLWYRVEKPHHHSVKGSEPPANPLKPPAKSVKYLG
jgi:hypothetical protein